MAPHVSERPVLLAPDSFKGTLPASAVARALGRGLTAAGRTDVDLCPVADGGEGTAEVLLERFGGKLVTVATTDPLGREIEASFAVLADGRAVVDAAAASGFALVGEHERDPEAASTAGTGTLIAAAQRSGAREILVGAGGTATIDGGAGALERIAREGGLRRDTRLTVLCDARVTYERAVEVFGAQKGATDPAVRTRLTRRLESFAAGLQRNPTGIAMGGCAGGLAGGLWGGPTAATLLPGGAFVLAAVDFDRRMRGARAVVVGEGRIDATTLEGKIAAEIAVRARQAGVPAFAVAGATALHPFEARILDLQAVLVAGNVATLERAGAELGSLIDPVASRRR